MSMAPDREAMLRQADALRAAAADMDMQSAALGSASNLIGLERAARRSADVAADAARRKGQDAQERFITGVRAQGMSLDDEIDFEVRGASAAAAAGGLNKYSAMIDRRKQLQEAGK